MRGERRYLKGGYTFPWQPPSVARKKSSKGGRKKKSATEGYTFALGEESATGIHFTKEKVRRKNNKELWQVL